jgi:hypothetical protein
LIEINDSASISVDGFVARVGSWRSRIGDIGGGHVGLVAIESGYWARS